MGKENDPSKEKDATNKKWARRAAIGITFVVVSVLGLKNIGPIANFLKNLL